MLRFQRWVVILIVLPKSSDQLLFVKSVGTFFLLKILISKKTVSNLSHGCRSRSNVDWNVISQFVDKNASFKCLFIIFLSCKPAFLKFFYFGNWHLSLRIRRRSPSKSFCYSEEPTFKSIGKNSDSSRICFNSFRQTLYSLVIKLIMVRISLHNTVPDLTGSPIRLPNDHDQARSAFILSSFFLLSFLYAQITPIFFLFLPALFAFPEETVLLSRCILKFWMTNICYVLSYLS